MSHPTDIAATIGEAQHSIMDKEASTLGTPQQHVKGFVTVRYVQRFAPEQMETKVTRNTVTVLCGSHAFRAMKTLAEMSASQTSYDFIGDLDADKA
jgi:hypothetical protein